MFNMRQPNDNVKCTHVPMAKCSRSDIIYSHKCKSMLNFIERKCNQSQGMVQRVVFETTYIYFIYINTNS